MDVIGYSEHSVAYLFLIVKSDYLIKILLLRQKIELFNMFLHSLIKNFMDVLNEFMKLSLMRNYEGRKVLKKDYSSYENDFNTFLMDNEQ